jgi:phospholipid/cholesterol/gamma-HCH transport system substrate-binding protein
METRANYLMVGVFVLALAIGLVGFVVWFGKFQFAPATTSWSKAR